MATLSRKTRPNGHVHELPPSSADMQCPTCGQPISVAQHAEILGSQRARETEIVKAAEARFAAKAASIRREATAAATAAVAAKLTKVDQEKRAALEQVRKIKAGFDAELKRRSEMQAEAAAKATDNAVNAATEKHVRENLRLAGMVNELTRTLEKKTANERGDEGEIDLLAILQSVPEFAVDTFTRIAKGVAGPDVVQTVMNGGIPVGRIAYEVKNTKRWSGTWTRKLYQDAITAQAEQAVLVVAPCAFPASEQQHGLFYHNSVMVVSAARLLPIVHLMRKHATQCHLLALTAESRQEKSDKLYLLLASNRVADLWERHADATKNLLELERSDETWQSKTRSRRTDLINGLRSMVHEEFLTSVERIMNGPEASA